MNLAYPGWADVAGTMIEAEPDLDHHTDNSVSRTRSLGHLGLTPSGL
jgi:hypothetical protein